MAHGFTPELTHFGSESVTPTNLLQHRSKYTTTINVKELHEAVRKTRQMRLDKRLEKEKHKRDDRNTFKVGQMVQFKEPPIRLNATVMARFSGPHVITEIQKDSLSATIQHMDTGRTRKAAMAALKLWKTHPLGHPANEEQDH